jgi:hypothetical protein
VGGYSDVVGVVHGFLLSGRITQALGVSPQGYIVGDYIDSLGKVHGFLFGKENKK